MKNELGLKIVKKFDLEKKLLRFSKEKKIAKELNTLYAGYNEVETLYEKYLGIVLNETERLTKLTNSLLTLNNLNMRGMVLEKTVFVVSKTSLRLLKFIDKSITSHSEVLPG